MSNCQVCAQPLQEGYGFCHFCGAPAGGGGHQTEGAPNQDLVELVDRVKEFSSQSKNLAGALQQSLDALLGSPVSLQRQICYSLLGGFALISGADFLALQAWLETWLVLSLLFLVPIRYWMTGVMPLSGPFNAILGPEISLRRRVIYSFLWSVLLPFVLAFVLTRLLSSWFGQGSWGNFAQHRSSALAIRIGPVEFSPMAQAGSFLFAFYLMGFAASWRAVWGCESSISRERMAGKAAIVAEQIRANVVERRVPSFELTKIDMAKLRRYTAGVSSGTEGAQLSFVSGRARVVVFVQDFGDALFIRWVAFFDASGRRLWLFIGYIVAALDRLVLRWFGSSFLEGSRQVSDTLSPASRNQLVLRTTRGGFIARTLRLAEGVSEYSWNEIYALEGTVRDAVIAVLQAAVGSHEEAERIREQIERHVRQEGAFRASAGRSPR